MAGPTKTTSQFTYVNIFQGKFVIRCNQDDPDPDKRMRKTKDGTEIWEIPYGKLEDMMLADIREAEHDQYGKSWEIIMEAGNNYYLLRIGKRSPVSNMFLSRLENIVLDKPITLTAWMPDGEDKNIISIWQDGQKVERAHTRENPNGLPEAKQMVVNNELVWDFSEQITFYSELVKSLRPHMAGVHREAAAVAQEQATAPPPATKQSGPAKQEAAFKEEPHGPGTQADDDNQDDLPF
jgi:hypothetical protein